MFNPQRVQQSWQSEVAAMAAATAELSEAAACQAIRADGWTIQDILGHTTTSARAFLAWCRAADPGTNMPTSERERDEVNDAQRLRMRQRPWAETCSYWDRLSSEVSEFLPTVTPELAARPLTIPWLSQVQTVGDALRVLVIHTRQHRNEIADGAQTLMAQADG